MAELIRIATAIAYTLQSVGLWDMHRPGGNQDAIGFSGKDGTSLFRVVS